jgi:hypothetical protein
MFWGYVSRRFITFWSCTDSPCTSQL